MCEPYRSAWKGCVENKRYSIQIQQLEMFNLADLEEKNAK